MKYSYSDLHDVSDRLEYQSGPLSQILCKSNEQFYKTYKTKTIDHKLRSRNLHGCFAAAAFIEICSLTKYMIKLFCLKGTMKSRNFASKNDATPSQSLMDCLMTHYCVMQPLQSCEVYCICTKYDDCS